MIFFSKVAFLTVLNHDLPIICTMIYVPAGCCSLNWWCSKILKQSSSKMTSLSHNQCNIRLEKGGQSLCGSPTGIDSHYILPSFGWKWGLLALLRLHTDFVSVWCLVKPDPVTNVEAERLSDDSLKISWTPPTSYLQLNYELIIHPSDAEEWQVRDKPE